MERKKSRTLPTPVSGSGGSAAECEPILVIDDREENLYSMRQILQAEGFTVETASSGEDALAYLMKANASLILCDVQMPGMDGFETAQRIRNNHRYRDVPILFVSAVYNSEEFIRYGYSIGAYDYLAKPVDEQLLINKVRIFQTLYQQNRALQRAAQQMEVEIEQRRRVELELEASIRSRDDFLASMSHELRTPLTSMIGYNELMVEGLGKMPRYQLMAENSMLAGKTLLQLVNDLLDMSKIRAGRFELNELPFDLYRLLCDIRELMEVYGQEKQIGLVLQVSAQAERRMERCVVADETRISQILFNLLSNAIKFSPAQSRVELTVDEVKLEKLELPNAWHCRFEVKDSGIGISDALQARLFTPFEQADSSISRHFGGTGLGLFIAKQLTQMMGGSIAVESVEQIGSTFIVQLPLIQSEAVAERYQSGVEGAQEVPQLQGCVLLAEDTPQLQKLASLLITATGAEVELASNGMEALRMGQEKCYALILMDMQMPEMDGIEATRRLREQGVKSPIVALTANVMVQHREQFEQAGVDGFLSKPIKRSRLYQTMAQHLQSTIAVEAATPMAEDPVAEDFDDEDMTDLLDEEMMQEFWDYIAEAKIELEQAWQAEEWEQLRKTAHAIKGMGASYGQPAMTEQAAMVQNLAPQGRSEQLLNAYQGLMELL